MKNKGLQPRLLYTIRLSIKMGVDKRSFLDKRRLKEYISTKLALQDMLKRLVSEKERKRVRGRGTQVRRE